MFKGNKEKDNNYISTEEVDKIYEFQKKAFNAQIAEQDKKIEELVDYVSARFGEDISNSNVETRLKNIENNLQEIQINYKTNLEQMTKSIKKEIEKENKKITTDNISVGKEDNKKISNLDQKLQQHIEDEELYKKEIEKEFKNTNQKISKINYLGITSKFDKKIKEECGKINGQIKEIKDQTEEDITKLGEQFLDNLKQVHEKYQASGEEILKLQNMFVTENEKVIAEIENNENRVVALDEGLTDKIEDINKDLQKIENSVTNLDKKLIKEISIVNENSQNIQNSANNLEEKLLKEIQETNTKLKNNELVVKKIDKTLSDKTEKINLKVKENETATNRLDKKIEAINAKTQNNEMTIVGLEAKWTKQNEQTREAINKLKDISKNKNIKLEEKIKLADEKLIATQEEINSIRENLDIQIETVKQEANNKYIQFETDTNEKIDTKLQEVVAKIENPKNEISKINNSLKQIKKDTLLETEKIKDQLNEQIINSQNENKSELENIAGAVENIKGEMEETITAIGQEISNLKQEVKTNLENHDNTDIEILKKDYNKYVTKMNNELAKISKDLINAQKKNLEQNRNLQVKIKAYIDAKIEKSSNTEKVEGLINDLNLSILEREKLQKLEMEELLSKKLKEIQKENERILNKKIEEISSRLIRENSINTRQKPNNVTLYEETPKKKKNMYELIDEEQILKRSAASKNPLSTTKEGKSQILKFFYDDEE